MARRKAQAEEHENHERWLVSYADFITLLFAFFVVMYSISSINEGKYRVLSDTMDAAFREEARSVNPIQIGEVVRSLAPSNQAVNPPSGIQAGIEKPPQEVFVEEPGEAGEALQDSLGDLTGGAGGYQDAGTVEETIRQRLSPLIDEGLVEVRRQDDWVEVELKSETLFSSGSSSIQAAAIPTLEEISLALLRFRNPVQVEGYTDDVPIETPVFPSNWELSAARAASVVNLLSRFGMDPVRMTAVGYGEYSPVAPNDTAAGRSKNRRVVLIVSAQDDPRKTIQLRSQGR